MKKITYTLLLCSLCLFFSCEKSDFSPDQDREFAMLVVQVTDAASHAVQQCGGPDVLQNISVTLYLSPEDRQNRLNPVSSKVTQSRGGVTFNKLQGNTYYIAIRSNDVQAQRSITIKNGEVKNMRVAVDTQDVG